MLLSTRPIPRRPLLFPRALPPRSPRLSTIRSTIRHRPAHRQTKLGGRNLKLLVLTRNIHRLLDRLLVLLRVQASLRLVPH
jgi:hypothetical protein